MNPPDPAEHLIATNAIASPTDDPEWFHRAVFYEVMVRSFADSNGDGIGDFAGLAGKLDYLQWLGVDCLWLPPFFPSPLADGGYDISDYTSVLPELGTVEEFRAFVEGAHERGLRIIIDFVMNHTSDAHPWFIESRNNPDGPYGDYYVWADDDSAYADARIIFVDSETSNWTYDPVRGQYFWHRFYSHQPDLNFDNPAVLEEMKNAIRFWMDMGIDGFRLDAVPYLIERDETNCENLTGTHDILKAVRAMVDEEYPGRILLCEANQWPREVVEYFGDGDECHMAFHFPVMPRLYMGLRQESRRAISEILADTPEIPAGCQWGTFLRNHDELTLEMVSDAEREYMWAEYAPDERMKCNIGIRRRLAPLVDGDLARVHLLHALLLALPGSPVLYYGDEIGMGDNIWLHDRDGVRTPMQWTAEEGAGFSTADPDDFYLPLIDTPRYSPAGVNVEQQMGDPASMLVWLRAMLVRRRAHPVFAGGSFTDLGGDNEAVFSFVRENDDEAVLCVNNLSARPQTVTLDLARFDGAVPLNLLADQRLARVTRDAYTLEVAPHGFYWLDLASVEAEPEIEEPAGGVDPVAHRREVLWHHIADARWFAGKGRAAELGEVVALPWYAEPGDGEVAVRPEIAEVRFDDGSVQHYQLLLGYRAELGGPEDARLGVVELDEVGRRYVTDAVRDPDAMAPVWRDFLGSGRGDGWRTGYVQHPIVADLAADEEPWPFGGDQSNSAVMFGSRAMYKLFRRLELGRNLDIEVHEALSQDDAVDAAALYGWTSAFWPVGDQIERADLAMVVEQLHHAHDGFRVALEACTEGRDFTAEAGRLGAALRSVHRALAVHFPTDVLPGVVLVDAMNHRLDQAAVVAPPLRAYQPALRERFGRLVHDNLDVQRVHGDFHLGQVLFTDTGPKIIDFEGEPMKTMAERVRPDTPWRDVAGALRSFDYASGTVAQENPGDAARAHAWAAAAREAFLAGYAPDGLSEADVRVLEAYVADKAVYEVIYELRNRPTWVTIPLTALAGLTGVETPPGLDAPTDEGTL